MLDLEGLRSNLKCHFPLSGQSKDGDLRILATQIAPDKIGRPRVVCKTPPEAREPRDGALRALMGAGSLPGGRSSARQGIFKPIDGALVSASPL
jgi:hypothetical protein